MMARLRTLERNKDTYAVVGTTEVTTEVEFRQLNDTSQENISKPNAQLNFSRGEY